MDPASLAMLFKMMFGGGGGAGGGTPPGPEMPPAPPVPNVAGSAAMPMSTGAAPRDVPQAPKMFPEASYLRQILGLGGDMSGTGGVPFQQSQAMTGLGDALQPAGAPPPMPAPGTPMPVPAPGQPPGGSPGYYGGSPETNPNLRPQGTPGGPPGPMDVAKLLGGIRQPQGPDIVKPSTPAAPQRGQVGPSDLFHLLQAIMPGAGHSLRLPTTLGQALSNRPAGWGGLYG